MPKSTVQEDDPYPLPENVPFPVELVDCQEDVVNFTKKDGSPGSFRKWNWTFNVYDGEFLGTEIKAGTEPKVTTATDAAFLPLARPIVEALLGRPLEFGEDVDTDLLIGAKALATVKHLEPRPRKTGDGFWFNVEVDEIFPPYGNNVTGGGGTVANDSTGAAAPGTYAEPPY
jgi:hypothetical protein